MTLNKPASILLLFLASVLLNFYLGGVMLGNYVKEQRAEADAHEAFMEMSKTLPELQKQRFRKLPQQLEAETAEDVATLKVLREESFRLLTAETFSREDFNAKEEQILELANRVQQKRSYVIGSLAEELSQAERQKLVAIIRKNPQ